MSDAEVSFEALAGLWQEGQRRIDAAGAADRAAMERVVDELVVELRRRLGSAFTVAELARLYLRQGTDWCYEIAVRAAPERPGAWDIGAVSGAAFARYAREASDYALGRRAVPADPGG
ncbi:MAG TPA: hypothetical protein VKV27_02710 [Solirubrobacteraceae bacterium]|nr:hypothetical protein [Solirubrobacteraceae bacterium]